MSPAMKTLACSVLTCAFLRLFSCSKPRDMATLLGLVKRPSIIIRATEIVSADALHGGTGGMY